MARIAWFDKHQPDASDNLNYVYLVDNMEKRARQQLKLGGNAQAAARLCEEALALRREHLPGSEYISLKELGNVYFVLGRDEDAAICYRQAADMVARQFYPEHPALIPIIDDWARWALERGNLVEAERLCQHSLQLKQKAILPNDIHTVETMRTLGEVLRRLEKYKEAESILKQGLKHVEDSTIGPVEEFYLELALVYQDQGLYETAEGYFRAALPIFARRAGKNARFAMALKYYATLLRQTHRGLEARRLDEEADAILNSIPPREKRIQNNSPQQTWMAEGLYACTILH
jgi:tetratricopeptide (TPR) repeat protein